MRVKLSEKYQNERQKICDKIIEILELDEFNSFLLSELDANETKKTKIMELRDEIPKYFACSEMAAFKPESDCKRPYLTIARGILRKQGYLFRGSQFHLKTDDEDTKITQQYIIIKPNN
jgi:hypothetical protein